MRLDQESRVHSAGAKTLRLPEPEGNVDDASAVQATSGLGDTTHRQGQ